MHGRISSKVSATVAAEIRQFYDIEHVSVFVGAKQFKRLSAKNVHELWTLNTYYVTKESFPSLCRCAKVVHIQEREISPLDNSLQVMEEKNEELTGRVEKIKRTGIWTSNFTMALKGVIDAAVNGGIQMYKHFLTEEFLEQHPDKKPEIDRLSNLVAQQMDILHKALQVHKLVRPENLHGLHDHLEGMYQKMKQDVQSQGKAPVSG
jgi:dedicator of cytokinesis protein 1